MTPEPRWVPEAVVLATQEELLERFGGSPGLRDPGLLDSALHRPRHLFAHGTEDLFALAAALATGIVKNHPFLDGNKRTGFMAAYIFLGSNGWSFQAPEEEVVERTLALAAGAIGEAEYRHSLGQSSVREPREGH